MSNTQVTGFKWKKSFLDVVADVNYDDFGAIGATHLTVYRLYCVPQVFPELVTSDDLPSITDLAVELAKKDSDDRRRLPVLGL